MFVFSIFNCFNYLLFAYCYCCCCSFCFGFGFFSLYMYIFFFCVPRDWAPKDLGNELGRAYNLYRQKQLAKQSQHLRRLMLLLQSINQSIIVKAAANVPSQPISPFAPLSFPNSVQLSLAVRPSFIRIFQLTFKRRVFPLCESGPQLSDGRQPGRNGLYWWHHQVHFCASL